MDRLAQEKQTSQDKSSDAAIEALYAVISGYNGIIRTIIERTEPVKGKWSTRKSVDQSTVMYLAEVLKGLIEPLKHLEFQLNQVHDPDLASLQYMMNNLVNIIDDSPPFKMLDVEKYKFGIPNYEGLADDLNITDGKAYVALLKNKEMALKDKLQKMKPFVRSTKSGQVSQKLFSRTNDLLENIKKEIKKAQHIVDAQLEDIYLDGQLIVSTEEILDALDELYLPPVENDVKADKIDTSEEKKKLAKLVKSKESIEAAYSDLLDADGNFDAQSLPGGHKKNYLYVLQRITSQQRKLGIDKEKKAAPAPASASASAPAAAAPEEAPPQPGPPPPPEEAPPPAPIEGSGKPLADLLANPKQQYNYMQRPVSDDQKIQNDMINANRNWQIKNNGPHDTPLGNLNPFLAQDNASKYSYEVLLANKNAQEHPETNALGADISLLQGPIANIEGSGKKSKALLRLKEVAVDEKNDLYKKVDLAPNGMIPEEKEDQFKLPDLKPKKRK